MQHEIFIKKAIALAHTARKKGNHPFGALLVKNNTIVLTSENTVITDNDITKHAELNLVSIASQKFSPEDLQMCTLYSSTEPCPMCVGAIYWAGIRHVVYSVSASLLEKMAPGGFHISSREIFHSAQHKTTIIGPVYEEEGLCVHNGFWEDQLAKER